MTFGITLWINFPDRLNLVICNKYIAKTSFFNFRPIKNRFLKKNHVFSKSFLGPYFFLFFYICLKNGRFGDPLQNPMGAKMATKFHMFNIKSCYFQDAKTSFFQTLFSQNRSNYCAVGTSWLSKGHFFNGDWLIFCLCCVSLCSVLYNLFISFCFFKKDR